MSKYIDIVCVGCVCSDIPYVYDTLRYATVSLLWHPHSSRRCIHRTSKNIDLQILTTCCFSKTSGQYQSPICRFVNKTSPAACHFGHFPYLSHSIYCSIEPYGTVCLPTVALLLPLLSIILTFTPGFFTHNTGAHVCGPWTPSKWSPVFLSVVFLVFCCLCCFLSIVALCLLYFLSLFFLFFVNLSLLPYPTRKKGTIEVLYYHVL